MSSTFEKNWKDVNTFLISYYCFRKCRLERSKEEPFELRSKKENWVQIRHLLRSCLERPIYQLTISASTRVIPGIVVVLCWTWSTTQGWWNSLSSQSGSSRVLTASSLTTQVTISLRSGNRLLKQSSKGMRMFICQRMGFSSSSRCWWWSTSCLWFGFSQFTESSAWNQNNSGYLSVCFLPCLTSCWSFIWSILKLWKMLPAKKSLRNNLNSPSFAAF